MRIQQMRWEVEYLQWQDGQLIPITAELELPFKKLLEYLTYFGMFPVLGIRRK